MTAKYWVLWGLHNATPDTHHLGPEGLYFERWALEEDGQSPLINGNIGTLTTQTDLNNRDQFAYYALGSIDTE